MLVLSLSTNDTVTLLVGEEKIKITVTILEIRGKRVKLGFEADLELVKILRDNVIPFNPKG